MDKNLIAFRSECKRMKSVLDYRKRIRNKLRETEYYLSKPDQANSHLFPLRNNDSGKYLENLSKKYQYSDMLKEMDQWIGQIEHIIDNVPAVSMKYFIWVIWLEQKKCEKVADEYLVAPGWLSRTIRSQLKESIAATDINVQEMDIFNELVNVSLRSSR